MSKSHRMPLFGFVKWLSNSYIELEKKTLPNACRLIGIITRNNTQLVQVQFSGQSHKIEIDPKKIIELNLFEYFSSVDKKKLFSLVYKQEQLILTDRYYCHESNNEMLVLTDISTGNKMTISAEMASANEPLIKKINSSDANKIGFLAGMNYIKKYFKNL